MFEIILQIIMMLGAGVAGYSICAIQKPEQPRDPKTGRYIKKGH